MVLVAQGRFVAVGLLAPERTPGQDSHSRAFRLASNGTTPPSQGRPLPCSASSFRSRSGTRAGHRSPRRRRGPSASAAAVIEARLAARQRLEEARAPARRHCDPGDRSPAIPWSRPRRDSAVGHWLPIAPVKRAWYPFSKRCAANATSSWRRSMPWCRSRTRWPRFTNSWERRHEAVAADCTRSGRRPGLPRG